MALVSWNCKGLEGIKALTAHVAIYLTPRD